MEEPPTQQLSTPPSPARRQPNKRLLLIGAVLVGAMLAGLIAGLAFRHFRHAASPTTARQSLVLYYRDGKTVLWQSSTKDTQGAAPAFVAYVQQQLDDQFGSYNVRKGSWKVTTALDRSLQATAEQQRATLQKPHVSNMALVAEDVTTGQIVSWVGGFNKVTSGDTVTQKWQLGSQMLPLTYAAYLENTPDSSTASIVNDSPVALPGYLCNHTGRPSEGGNCPFDYDFTYDGALSLANALAKGRQVPALRAAAAISTETTLTTAKAMGSDGQCYEDHTLTKPTACFLSAAIGAGLYGTPAHSLQADATLANHGVEEPQTAYLQVAHDGKTVYAWHASPKQAIKAATADALISALSDPSISALKPLSREFATASGVHTAVIDGVTLSGDSTSMTQLSSRYAVGAWIAYDASSFLTPEQTTLSATYAWLSAAQ